MQLAISSYVEWNALFSSKLIVMYLHIIVCSTHIQREKKYKVPREPFCTYRVVQNPKYFFIFRDNINFDVEWYSWCLFFFFACTLKPNFWRVLDLWANINWIRQKKKENVQKQLFGWSKKFCRPPLCQPLIFMPLIMNCNKTQNAINSEYIWFIDK